MAMRTLKNVCKTAVLYSQRPYYIIDKKYCPGEGRVRRILKEKGVFCLYFSVAKGVAKAKNNSCARKKHDFPMFFLFYYKNFFTTLFKHDL